MMQIESNPKNTFITTDFSQYTVVGFHGTSQLFSSNIEKQGFLPNKIFSVDEHQLILSVAMTLKIDTWLYSDWFQIMRSVTFAKDHIDALNHVKSSSSSAQGLDKAKAVLLQICAKGSDTNKEMANIFLDKIDTIQKSNSVIYAVDLSNLGERLCTHTSQPRLYQIYLNPSEPIPESSIVSPDRLIARLDVL